MNDNVTTEICYEPGCRDIFCDYIHVPEMKFTLTQILREHDYSTLKRIKDEGSTNANPVERVHNEHFENIVLCNVCYRPIDASKSPSFYPCCSVFLCEECLGKLGLQHSCPLCRASVDPLPLTDEQREFVKEQNFSLVNNIA